MIKPLGNENLSPILNFMKPTAFQKFIALLFYPFIFVLAILLILEEWLWEKTLVLTQKIANLPVVKQIESLFRKLPPYWALVALCLPWLLLLPVKLLAVRLVSHHKPVLGVVVLLSAKVAGTAILARIFALTRDEALKIAWFKKVYESILFLISWAKQWMKNSKAYQMARVQINSIKEWWRLRRPSFLGKHFRVHLKLNRKILKKKNQD